MVLAQVARQVVGSPNFNTLNTRIAELRFQKAPGEVHERRRITGLNFRVEAQGDVIQQGTDTDGLIRMRVRGESSDLLLLFNGQVVARYEVSIHLEELDETLLRHGLEQHFRILGYHIGHAGPAKDGVIEVVDPPPPGPPKPPENALDFERSVIDFQVDQSDDGQTILPNGDPSGATTDRISREADK